MPEPAPGEETAAEQLIWLVRRFREAMTDTLVSQGEEPIPPAAKWLLLSAARRPGTVGELARRLGVTKQAVSRMADTLVRQGCAVRTTDPADRRDVIVEATADGQRVAAALGKSILALEDELLAVLPARRRAEFLAALAELTRTEA